MSSLDWHTPVEDEPGFREALKQIAEPEAADSAWRTLWDRLVHQYDIDDTGIKVLPILVVMARKLLPKQRYQHLALIGSIVYCSQLPGSRWVLESAPQAIRQAFTEAAQQSAELVAQSLFEQWNMYQTKDLFVAYAAARGCPQLADHLDRYEVPLTCPKCKHSFSAPSSVGT